MLKQIFSDDVIKQILDFMSNNTPESSDSGYHIRIPFESSSVRKPRLKSPLDIKLWVQNRIRFYDLEKKDATCYSRGCNGEQSHN